MQDTCGTPKKNGSQRCSLSSYILFLFNSDLIERTKFISSLSRYVVVLDVSTDIIIKTGAWSASSTSQALRNSYLRSVLHIRFAVNKLIMHSTSTPTSKLHVL